MKPATKKEPTQDIQPTPSQRRELEREREYARYLDGPGPWDSKGAWNDERDDR